MLYPGNGKSLFEQLKDILLEKIKEGEYKEGDKLPSERELSEMYGISRVTVRQTLNELVNEGVLTKRQGKGSYVAFQRIENRLDSLLGFVEEFAIKNSKCEVVLLRNELVTAPAEACIAMQAQEGTTMLLIVRHIFVDGRSIGIDYTYVPRHISYLLKGMDFSKDILYAFLEHNGYKLAYADQTITAEQPAEEEARLLKIEATAPMLAINRTAYVEGDRPIVYSRTVYRSDRYSYALTLKRYPIQVDIQNGA